MRTLYFAAVVTSSWFFLASSQRSQIGCIPSLHTRCGPSANLGCMYETCCIRLAGNAGRKKIAKNSPSAHHRTILSGHIFATKARIGKKLLNSNMFSTCPHNMLNFGPLTAGICWRAWATPANFNRFRVLAALLHGALVVGVSQTLRR